MPDRPTLRFICNVIRDRNYSRQDYIMNLLGEGRGGGGGKAAATTPLQRGGRREGLRWPPLPRFDHHYSRGTAVWFITSSPFCPPWKLSGPLRCERVEIIGRDIASRSFFQGLSNDRGIIPVHGWWTVRAFAFRMRKMDGRLVGWGRELGREYISEGGEE